MEAMHRDDAAQIPRLVIQHAEVPAVDYIALDVLSRFEGGAAVRGCTEGAVRRTNRSEKLVQEPERRHIVAAAHQVVGIADSQQRRHGDSLIQDQLHGFAPNPVRVKLIRETATGVTRDYHVTSPLLSHATVRAVYQQSRSRRNTLHPPAR